MENRLFIQLREKGQSRHGLLGRSAVGVKRVHAVSFASFAEAKHYVDWMFDNNPGAFDSGRILDGKRIVYAAAPPPVEPAQTALEV
jgi:hypothetical protein